MALTQNGKRIMAHVLGGGIGYLGLSSFEVYARNNVNVKTVGNLLGYAGSSASSTSNSYGVYLYVGYGETPSDRQYDTSAYARYMANEAKLPAVTAASLDSGVNTVSFVITNLSSTDSRTYNRYGIMISDNATSYASANTYILSYYDLPQPITLAPGESKTVDLTFDVSNI